MVVVGGFELELGVSRFFCFSWRVLPMGIVGQGAFHGGLPWVVRLDLSTRWCCWSAERPFGKRRIGGLSTLALQRHPAPQ